VLSGTKEKVNRLLVCLLLLVVIGAVFAFFKTEERDTLIEQMPGQVTQYPSGYAQVYGRSGPELARHERCKITGSTFKEVTEVAIRLCPESDGWKWTSFGPDILIGERSPIGIQEAITIARNYDVTVVSRSKRISRAAYYLQWIKSGGRTSVTHFKAGKTHQTALP
jgi:hypothetical protein